MAEARHITVLQFGTVGQLARELIRAASDQAHLSIRALHLDRVDFRYPEQVIDAVRTAGPVDVVINATAYTAVDKAESEQDLARQINAQSVAALAQTCSERDIPLIHVSTDYVFDGTKAEPYLESDEPNPLGAYGRTKLEGEEAIRVATDRHVIVRTSWVYSAHGSNFVKTMLRLGAERDELRIVDDQHGAPTSSANLASAILAMVTQIATGGGSDLFGTFHYADQGETTWRRFAEAIFEEAAPWTAIKARVIPVTTSEYPTAARRPLNSRLNCTKIERVYGIVRPSWRVSLTRVMEEIKAACDGGVA
jgi:dTDP-4-dehydrorhamnose reductase